MGGKGVPGAPTDLGNFENPKICLPTVKFKERVVIGAQRGRKIDHGGDNSIQHAAYARAVEVARMNCKTHDPPGALIHDDHDPVTTQEQRFADSADYGAPRTMKRFVLVPGMPVEQTSL